MKNIRYIKQRDETSCGPIAIINILKWLGCNITYKYLDTARTLCGWESGNTAASGTTDRGLRFALNTLKIYAIHRNSPNLKLLDNHLNKGGAAIVEYIIPRCSIEKGWHFALCVGKENSSYIIVNDGYSTVSYYKRSTISKMWRQHKKYCSYWLIYR